MGKEVLQRERVFVKMLCLRKERERKWINLNDGRLKARCTRKGKQETNDLLNLALLLCNAVMKSDMKHGIEQGSIDICMGWLGTVNSGSVQEVGLDGPQGSFQSYDKEGKFSCNTLGKRQ